MEFLVSYFQRTTTFQHLSWIIVLEIKGNAILGKSWVWRIHQEQPKWPVCCLACPGQSSVSSHTGTNRDSGFSFLLSVSKLLPLLHLLSQNTELYAGDSLSCILKCPCVIFPSASLCYQLFIFLSCMDTTDSSYGFFPLGQLPCGLSSICLLEWSGHSWQ